MAFVDGQTRSERTGDCALGLSEVVATELLGQRPTRAGDHAAEARAYVELAQGLGDEPGMVLEALARKAMELTGAGSSGISVVEGEGESRRFRWCAVAGEFFPFVGATLPWDLSPCGVVLDRNAPQLMRDPARLYPYVAELKPAVSEVLLVPFHRGEEPIGTVWVVAHVDSGKRFDGEDVRVVAGLARFASAAVRGVENLRGIEAARRTLEGEVEAGRRAAAELVEARRKLDAALIAGEVGTFEWEIETDRLWGDRNFRRIFGVAVDEVGAAPLERYVAAIHAGDRGRVSELVRRAVETGCDYEAEYRIVLGDGVVRWAIARGKVERGADGRASRFPGVVLDVTERRRAEEWLGAQNRALEVAAGPASLGEALGVLAGIVEEQSAGDAVAAVLLLREDGTLWTGAAPGLPAEYCAAIDGIEAAAGVGTCCDAAALDRAVVTRDIAGAESWRGIAHLPLGLGLRAAWSMPIRGSDGRVLGTMGTYFRTCRGPTDWERQVVEGLCRTAALAIERRAGVEALREKEGKLRVALGAAELGAWTYRMADGRWELDERAQSLYGTGAAVVTHDAALMARSMHPEDVPRMWEAVRRACDPAGSGQYAMEYRFRRAEGGYRWLRAWARVQFEGEGESRRAVRMVGSTRDITEAREAEELLRRAKEEAERASAAKSEFLATLSHELRTPLTPVLLTASLLEGHPALAEELREDVIAIRRNVELESRLISDLLDLTRIEKGKLQLERKDLDLHQVVRAAIDVCRGEAACAVAVELAASRRVVRGDGVRLQQVFWNLVNNAIKFTPAGGRIAVRSGDGTDGRVVVEVEDTGAGIDAGVLPRLFNAFEQGEAREGRQRAGLGLGLAISRRLVEAHGGTIAARSAGRGCGAVFTVELPAREGHVAAVVGNGHAMAAAAGVAECLRVLVVEDHEATLKVMRKLLKGMGHRVTGANSVASAVAAARREEFDLIISDVGLPDGSGLDVMKELRGKYQGRAVALSGYGMESDLAASREAGFAEHLTKPVDVGMLRAAIGRVAGAGKGKKVESRE